ncbi:MAG: hypothetical protein R3F62_19120 [Planctomycetota bacterium]
MKVARPIPALLLLLAFCCAQLVHALHPLAHARDAGACRGEALQAVDPGPAVARVDADHDADHALECALCATGLPLASPLDPSPEGSIEAAGAPATAAVVTAPARGPPASFRSRAPPVRA